MKLESIYCNICHALLRGGLKDVKKLYYRFPGSDAGLVSRNNVRFNGPHLAQVGEFCSLRCYTVAQQNIYVGHIELGELEDFWDQDSGLSEQEIAVWESPNGTTKPVVYGCACANVQKLCNNCNQKINSPHYTMVLATADGKDRIKLICSKACATAVWLNYDPDSD